MFLLKSTVWKLAFWSVVLFALVAYTGVAAIWNNQPSFSGGTPDFNYWQAKYEDIAYQLATTQDTKNSTQVAITVQNATIVQSPIITSDGSTQQRVDRCESCHIGIENPSMTAENIIKTVDHVTVTADQVPDYLQAHPKTRAIVFTLGAHPGRGAYDTLTPMSLILSRDKATVSSDDAPAYLTAHPDTKAYVYQQLGISNSTSVDDAVKVQKIVYQNGVVKGALDWAVVVGDESNATAHARAAEDDHVVSSHPFATYGCTTCHYGSGRELLQDRAHGDSEFWLQPMLPSKYQEAACAQCHEKFNGASFAATYLPEMSTIARGQQLFKQNACWGCHKIEGFSKGNVGPELTIEGRIATYKSIEHQLWDPRYKVNGCIMPYFFSQKVYAGTVGSKNVNYVMDSLGKKTPASDVPVGVVQSDDTRATLLDHGYIPDARRQADVDALVTFICAQTGLNYAQDRSTRLTRLTNYNVSPPDTVPVTTGEGKILFEQSGCYSCHYLGDPNNVKNGHGGYAGPNLSWEGSRHSRQWIDDHYLNPQAFVPKSVMPVFPFSDSQRAALTLYDTTMIPKGGKQVSPDQDEPSLALKNDDIVIPQPRYMTR